MTKMHISKLASDKRKSYFCFTLIFLINALMLFLAYHFRTEHQMLALIFGFLAVGFGIVTMTIISETLQKTIRKKIES